VRPLRQPAHPRGNHPADPSTTSQIPEGSSSLPIIGRRLPASSSFVLAATRLRALQLDPGPRDGTTGRDEESHNNTHPPARRPQSHRSPGQTTAPLDSKDPHGCVNARSDALLGTSWARSCSPWYQLLDKSTPVSSAREPADLSSLLRANDDDPGTAMSRLKARWARQLRRPDPLSYPYPSLSMT
jgi:hypothetical protein